MVTNVEIKLARWLAGESLGRSACALLGDEPGRDANDIRELARSTAPSPGVYALGIRYGVAIAVPVRVEPARGALRGPLAETLRVANVVACEILGAPALPPLDCPRVGDIEPTGASIGLAIVIAMIAHYTDRTHADPVFATGAITEDRRIGAVADVARKLSVARAETRDGRAILLAPRDASHDDPVETVDAAVARVFGDGRLHLRANLRGATDALANASVTLDSLAAAEHLLAVAERGDLTEGDRAHLMFAAGIRLRHAGDSDRASKLHAHALPRIRAARRFLGGELVERHEIEAWASRVDDDFAFDDCLVGLRARLKEPFTLVHNEVRCRGLLAQVLAMSGDPRAAVELREVNLADQVNSGDMRAEIPRTLCHLAFDSARAGDASGFDRHVGRLCGETAPGDRIQWRYNAAAIVRGLAALGRFREAIAWVHDDAPDLCEGAVVATEVFRASDASAISDHPEVSTVRALVRAFRRIGDPRSAIALAERVVIGTDTSSNLVAWLAALARLEGALGRGDLDGPGAADVEVGELLARLRSAHPPASDAYSGVFEAPPGRLEGELDRVWY